MISFFLDLEGRIDSASGKSKEFCDRYFPKGKRADDYFPIGEWEYIQAVVRRQASASDQSIFNESLVFCLLLEEGVADCLLQKMGGSGYLLSLVHDA